MDELTMELGGLYLELAKEKPATAKAVLEFIRALVLADKDSLHVSKE